MDLARIKAMGECGKPCFSFLSPVRGLSWAPRGHCSGGQYKSLP